MLDELDIAPKKKRKEKKEKSILCPMKLSNKSEYSIKIFLGME